MSEPVTILLGEQNASNYLRELREGNNRAPLPALWSLGTGWFSTFHRSDKRSAHPTSKTPEATKSSARKRTLSGPNSRRVLVSPLPNAKPHLCWAAVRVRWGVDSHRGLSLSSRPLPILSGHHWGICRRTTDCYRVGDEGSCINPCRYSR